MAQKDEEKEKKKKNKGKQQQLKQTRDNKINDGKRTVILNNYVVKLFDKMIIL